MTTPTNLSHLSPDTSSDTYPTEVSASADTLIDPTPPSDRFQPTPPGQPLAAPRDDPGALDERVTS